MPAFSLAVSPLFELLRSHTEFGGHPLVCAGGAAAVHVLVSSVLVKRGGTTALRGLSPISGDVVLFAAVELSP